MCIRAQITDAKRTSDLRHGADSVTCDARQSEDGRNQAVAREDAGQVAPHSASADHFEQNTAHHGPVDHHPRAQRHIGHPEGQNSTFDPLRVLTPTARLFSATLNDVFCRHLWVKLILHQLAGAST